VRGRARRSYSSLNPNTDPIKVQTGTGSAGYGSFERRPSLAENEGETLNVTLSSALRHEIEIVSVPHVRLWDDLAEVHSKMKRKSCLYNPGCFCVVLAKLFVISSMHACVWTWK